MRLRMRLLRELTLLLCVALSLSKSLGMQEDMHSEVGDKTSKKASSDRPHTLGPAAAHRITTGRINAIEPLLDALDTVVSQLAADEAFPNLEMFAYSDGGEPPQGKCTDAARQTSCYSCLADKKCNFCFDPSESKSFGTCGSQKRCGTGKYLMKGKGNAQCAGSCADKCSKKEAACQTEIVSDELKFGKVPKLREELVVAQKAAVEDGKGKVENDEPTDPMAAEVEKLKKYLPDDELVKFEVQVDLVPDKLPKDEGGKFEFNEAYEGPTRKGEFWGPKVMDEFFDVPTRRASCPYFPDFACRVDEAKLLDKEIEKHEKEIETAKDAYEKAAAVADAFVYTESRRIRQEILDKYASDVKWAASFYPDEPEKVRALQEASIFIKRKHPIEHSSFDESMIKEFLSSSLVRGRRIQVMKKTDTRSRRLQQAKGYLQQAEGNLAAAVAQVERGMKSYCAAQKTSCESECAKGITIKFEELLDDDARAYLKSQFPPEHLDFVD